MLLVIPVRLQAQEASILNPSGLPVPRYVSLKSDFVNARVGPGKRYPIRWVYTRKNLPVEIIEEFAHWRRIRDANGDNGWVHKGLLAGARTILIAEKSQNLYTRPDATSRPVLRASINVIGTLKSCIPDWCEVTIRDHTGWIRKADIWGVTREEVFEK
jgi:SH3-like domain-containing protein